MIAVIDFISVGLFSGGQIAGIAIVAILLAACVGVNIWLGCLLHKRGVHKLHTETLQHQRDALMEKLNAMRSGAAVEMQGFTGPVGVLFPPKEIEAVVSDDDDGEQEEPLDEADEQDDEEEGEPLDVRLTDTGKVMRYNYSFTARITQADTDLKARYSELKNYIMSYGGMSARMSWKKETFHIGRRNAASFVVRGKTLCIFLAVDPALFDGTKYKVEKVGSAKKTAMPCKYRITSDRKTGYTKELIDIVLAGFDVARKPDYVMQDFTLPYKSTEALVKRKLVKIVGDGIPDFAREDALAEARRIRYNRSFSARIIQSDDKLKSYYSKLKNHLLGYSGVRAVDSWKKESFVISRAAVASFVIRGKTLCLCLNDDPAKYENTKYRVESLSTRNDKAKMRLLYRIKNAGRVKCATQLIDAMFAEAGVAQTEHEYVNYAVPFVATDTLVRRGMIKVIELPRREEDYNPEERESAAQFLRKPPARRKTEDPDAEQEAAATDESGADEQ